MLADRDGMFAAVRTRLTQTQARAGQLETQLATLDQHLKVRNAEVEGAAQKIAQLELELDGARRGLHETSAELSAAQERLRVHQRDYEERIGALEAELAAARAELSARPAPASAVDTSDQISAILQASERAATRVIDLAADAHREQAEQIDRLRERIRGEAERLAEWRKGLEPAVGSIRSSIDRARTKLDEIPDRIREALAPLGEAVDAVSEQFVTLVDRAAEPEVQTDAGPPERDPAVEAASLIRSIHLDERENARAVDGSEDPGTPGWPAP